MKLEIKQDQNKTQKQKINNEVVSGDCVTDTKPALHVEQHRLKLWWIKMGDRKIKSGFIIKVI